ncbi:MAG: hypothetical protein ABEI52_06190 [Halobacteriaceae archaeon]
MLAPNHQPNKNGHPGEQETFEYFREKELFLRDIYRHVIYHEDKHQKSEHEDSTPERCFSQNLKRQKGENHGSCTRHQREVHREGKKYAAEHC